MILPNKVIVAAVAVLLVGSMLVSPVAGTSGVEHAGEPTIQVDIDTDGDATVSMVSVYDLDDGDEQDAFESLTEDEETQADLRDRFADRMSSVAENSGHDGETTINDASIESRSEDGYGVVTLSVTWNDLAQVEDGTLVVTEPFASGFETDRQLVITGPDGSTIESASHDPAVEDGTQVSWDEGTDLDGFELEIALDKADDGVPGFGVGIALVALIAVLGTAVHPFQY